MRGELAELQGIKLPEYTGTRIMMMPFLLHDALGSLPLSRAWREVIDAIARMRMVQGVGYLTIDEAIVQIGETHRRPGRHVDGVGGWGGGGGWAKGGMLMVASRDPAQAWPGEFNEEPGYDGDCAHVPVGAPERLSANVVYWCSSHLIHEAVPATSMGPRQFVRLSMPSLCSWFEGYTENPLGVKPEGPILPRRAKEMGYRA